jgi:hypothetical protein
MKITRIRITDYRGIEALDATIAPVGAIVKGSNGQAKTSVLKAIQAALAARDIGPDAIRIGANKAEIMIDMGDLSVRRAITAKGSHLSVSKDLGGQMAKLPEPQTFLRNLLGTSAIDPIELVTQKDKKKRRAQVLAALPVRVTAEQIRQWTGEDCHIDPDAHGLDVVSQLRGTYYDRRKDANAKAKEAHARADRARESGALLSGPPPAGPSIEEAQKARDAAYRHAIEIETARSAFAKSQEHTRLTRIRIDELRKAALVEVEGLTDPPEGAVEEAERLQKQWKERVEDLELELRDAREALSRAELHVSTTRAHVQSVAAARKRSASFTQQAADLEAAITVTTTAAPSVTEQEEADLAYTKASAALLAAHDAQARADRYREAVTALQTAEIEAVAADQEAARLDTIVGRLTSEAPAELLASCDGVRGLTIDGDDIYMEGVNLDGLCGEEQLSFAVEIAKRANAQSRILLVDGLERIAPEHQDDFVRLATADGWQLLATVVADGERMIEAIEDERTL